MYTIKLKEKEEATELDNSATPASPQVDDEKTRHQCKHQTQETTNPEHLPVKLERDPFQKPMHQCVFCKYNIPLDYKNAQLLSQFVSPHTGIVYGQQVTGLCIYMQSEVEKTVFKAKKLGFIPFFYKETSFTSDPLLFNQFGSNLKKIPNTYDKRKLNSD